MVDDFNVLWSLPLLIFQAKVPWIHDEFCWWTCEVISQDSPLNGAFRNLSELRYGLFGWQVSHHCLKDRSTRQVLIDSGRCSLQPILKGHAGRNECSKKGKTLDRILQHCCAHMGLPQNLDHDFPTVQDCQKKREYLSCSDKTYCYSLTTVPQELLGH